MADRLKKEDLPQVIIQRDVTGDMGTEGSLFASGFNCKVLELPWRDNEGNYSCIPAGEYFCQIRYSKKFGLTYHITDVEGRTWILKHSGNFAGDTKKGFKSHSHGCILLGKYFGWYKKQRAVLLSKPTLRRFMAAMHKKPFWLTIIDKTQEVHYGV